MVIKVYVSGISGNKEVKKHQQRVLMILDSKSIPYEVVDIAEPGKESDKGFMQQNSNAKNSKHPLPPQLFNEETYCGDYEDFDLANEVDNLEVFLKLSPGISKAEVTLDRFPSEKPAEEVLAMENGQLNGTSSREVSVEKEHPAAGDSATMPTEEGEREAGEEETLGAGDIVEVPAAEDGQEDGGEAPAEVEEDQGEGGGERGGEDEDEHEGEEEE